MMGISIKNITKQYHNTTALHNVSFDIAQGEIFGLLGPNGAGKTTCIRIITQMIAADYGEVLLFGEPLNSTHTHRIGYLPEERGLYRSMRVEEHIIYFAALKGMTKHEARTACTYWLQKFEIEHWRHKKIEELSKGMQQKIQFICAVIHNPKLLILDEPFSGLDPMNTETIKQEILELNQQGTTIILSTHNMNSVEELCNSITLIHNSQTILSGSVENIKRNYAKNFYTITFSGYADTVMAGLTTSYKIIEQHKTGTTTSITIELTEDVAPNNILKHNMNHGNIIDFRQVVPSMNDVFIQAVEEHIHTNN